MLVRSAHSANIKERRDASTALFDAEGAMVMQAEHIPVHLGAMPAAVAAVLGEDHAPGRRLDPERPLPRRHPPARHDGDLAALPRRRAVRLRRQPRPSRGRRRARARQHAGRLAHAGGRGRGDPADAADRGRRCASSPAGCATRASARPTCAPSWRPGARAPSACERCSSATGSRPCAPGCARRRTTPSAAPAPASPSSRTGRARRATCSRPPTATSSCGCARRSSGDELELDFGGTAAQHDGNLNCPLAVTVSACYFALRVLTDPDVPPCAGRVPAADRERARGLAPERAPAGRGGRRQRRDLLARGRPRARRVRPRAAARAR